MKYIDADKFIKKFEKMIDDIPASVDSGAGYVIDEVYKIFDSLQQEQPIDKNTLTWKDINDLERIINNVHYEFRAGIGEKSFGEEVLGRFMEERDEQEQPQVADASKMEQSESSVENYIQSYLEAIGFGYGGWVDGLRDEDLKKIARHFYKLGLSARKEG